MRINLLLLVAAVALSAYTDASSVRPSSTFERPTPSHQYEPQRFLRDGTKEERTFPSSTVLPLTKEVNQSLLSITEKQLLENILQSSQPGTGDNLLKNKQFIDFVTKVQENRNKEAIIAGILANHYTDGKFLKMLDTSTEDVATKDVAIRLQDGWIRFKVTTIEGKRDDNVIENALGLLILDDNLLRSSRFKAICELVIQRYEGETVVQNIAYYLGMCYGRKRIATLFEMLEKSMEDSDTEKIAKNLQEKLIVILINGKYSSRYMLHEVYEKNHDGDFLSSLGFKFWVKYATEFYKKKKNLEPFLWKMMAGDMASTYKDYDMLLKMLKKSMAKDIATRIYDGLLKYGIETNVPSNDIFKILNYQRQGNDKLSTESFALWVEYAKAYYTKLSEEEMWMAMVEDMATSYDDDKLLEMLELFANDPATKDFAIKLQDGWVQVKATTIEGEPADQVIDHALHLLILDDNLLSSPRFEGYRKLMKMKYKNHANDFMALDLAYRYESDPDALTTMLKKCMEDSDTKDIATRIYNGFVQEGITIDLPSYKIFKMLNRRLHGNNKLSTKRFTFWVKYATKYHNEKSEEEMWMTMAEDMASYDDDKLLEMLETFAKDPATKDFAIKLQDGWVQVKATTIEGEPADQVINHVRDLLIPDGNLLRSSRFKAYDTLMVRKYRDFVGDLMALDMAYLYERNPDALTKMLKKSIKDSDTKVYARRIKKSSVQKKSESPRIMLTMLKRQLHGNDKLSTLAFKFWVKYAKRYYTKLSEKEMWMKMAEDMALAYENDDDRLLTMLETCTKDPATKDAAIRLQDGWIQAKVKTTIEGDVPDELIEHVRDLLIPDENLLSSSRFETYNTLMTRKYKDGVNDAMAFELAYRYERDPDALTTMLKKSKDNRATEDIATQILNKLNIKEHESSV